MGCIWALISVDSNPHEKSHRSVDITDSPGFSMFHKVPGVADSYDLNMFYEYSIHINICV